VGAVHRGAERLALLVTALTRTEKALADLLPVLTRIADALEEANRSDEQRFEHMRLRDDASEQRMRRALRDAREANARVADQNERLLRHHLPDDDDA
jgi:hypothetical protein